MYWGPQDLSEYINVDAIVWCQPEANMTFSKCIAEVRELDTNDALYKKKLSTPLLKGNVIPSWLRFEPIAAQMLKSWGAMGLPNK